MAFDAFLSIDGIKGESQDDKHKDWIEIMSFSWGISQTGAAPGTSNGKPKVEGISVTKRTDTASPQLMLSCASGQHIKKAVLSCRTAGTTDDFLKITFQDILISGFAEGGHAGSEQEDTPTEQVSLNFGKIQLSFTPASSDSSPVTADAQVDSGN